MRTRPVDAHRHMEQGFPSPQTAAAARSDDLLDVLTELIDPHTDTVQLIMADERTELEWSAHCDYLRALQRVGRETLARHDQRSQPTPPPGLAIMARLTTALARSWTAAGVFVRSPARAAHTLPLHPIVQALDLRARARARSVLATSRW
jgi:hypothetical protein